MVKSELWLPISTDSTESCYFVNISTRKKSKIILNGGSKKWFGLKRVEVLKAALLGSIIIKYSDKNNGATARNRLELIGGSVISPKNGTCSRKWNFRIGWNIRWQYWIAIINQSTNQIRGSILADFGLFLVGLWKKWLTHIRQNL